MAGLQREKKVFFNFQYLLLTMTNNILTTSKIAWFFKRIILPVILVLFTFWLYVKCICFFRSKSSSADLVCALNWKDGIFLVASYAVVKVLSPLFGPGTIFKRFIATLILYSLSFALFAFPFWLSSFFQVFSANVFVHVSLMILTIEVIFDSLYGQAKS